MQEGANATHIRALPQVFKETQSNDPFRRRATGGGMGTIQSGGKGPAVAEREVRSPRRDRRPIAEGTLIWQIAIKAATTMIVAKWRS